MKRNHILIGAQRSTFVPPNHPNWTGKSHRSTAEAYGSSISGTYSEYQHPGPTRGDVVGIVVTGAAFLFFLFGGAAVFG